MSQEQQRTDISHETSQQLSEGAKNAINTGARKAGNLVNRGVSKATQGIRKKATEAVKKALKKAARTSAKAALRLGAKLLKSLAAFIIKFFPVIVAVAVIIFLIWFIFAFFIDDEYESKAEQDNYQTEDAQEDNRVVYEDGKYKITHHSLGNKMYKMFYVYMAQRGYWKILVDENGDPKGPMLRADHPQAQEMIDKYNREKKFILNSDLLYLLDTHLHAQVKNSFYFPEQFVQPVYHDEDFNLKPLLNEEGDVVAKSTKYDKNGKPTNKKEEGYWDYGFGAILQYQKFLEERERRGELRKTYEWDYENKKIVPVEIPEGKGKKITEIVEGYPKEVFLIRKVTNAIGTIEREIEQEWVNTGEKWTKTEQIEIETEKKIVYHEWKHERNSRGRKLYWKYDPNKKLPEGVKENKKITTKTDWPVMKKVRIEEWVPDTAIVEQTYEGYVWEKIPRYVSEVNTDGIVGEQYIFDYLTNYVAYIPDVVMEKFDVKRRTGKDIEGLEEVIQKQLEVENAHSVYDNVEGDEHSFEFTNQIDDKYKSAYNNAMRYIELFELYGNRYGVDPYLLLAKAAQESSGQHEEKKKSTGGYGLMQIEEPGRVIKQATAFNFETGEIETMHIGGKHDVDSVEDNIRAGAMLMAGRVKSFNYNVMLGLQAYNFGTPAMNIVLNKYSEETGRSIEDIKADHSDTGWMKWVQDFHENPHKYLSNWGYSTYGDPNYVSNVLRYYASPHGTPYVISEDGTKHAMDGTVEYGAAVVGSGRSGQGWFLSLLSSLKHMWSELFDDSPVNALQNKEDYTWKKHIYSLSEQEYRDFMILWRTFIENKNYSDIKEEWTLEDWKKYYESLFENPNVNSESNISEETLEKYQEIMGLFPDGFQLPVDKMDNIKYEYDGNILELSTSSNTVVKSPIPGTVTFVDRNNGVVEITQSNHVKIKLTGLKEIKVKNGDSVTAGQQIGKTIGELGFAITDAKGNSKDPTPIFEVYGSGTTYDYATVLASIESVKGTPYKMVGAANDPSFGYFDCSGLMQWAFKQAGINLPRTAQEQYNYVMKISESEAKPGDLIFFEGTYNAGRPITHVGLYIGGGKFWNAQTTGGVRLASLNNYWKQFRYHFGRIPPK